MTNLQEYEKALYESDLDSAYHYLEKLWVPSRSYDEFLDSAIVPALCSFSHRFSSMHVPKELEYLYRFIFKHSREQQLDFIKRFIEYLVWSPKYAVNLSKTYASGTGVDDYRSRFINNLENHEAIPSLFYIQKIAEDSLDDAMRVLLQIGCVDISQSIGHYLTCTEGMVKLGQRSMLPDATNSIFSTTLYLMHSKPIKLSEAKEPSSSRDVIFHKLLEKTGFSAYHYMIAANALVNQREFVGDEYYYHALASLEDLLPSLSTGMSHEYIEERIEGKVPDATPEELKRRIWLGDKSGAFSVLKTVFESDGVSVLLQNEIMHSYTRIDDHPHDPHYVTVPQSLFELINHLPEEDKLLALAHCVEFACDRVKMRGVMS